MNMENETELVARLITLTRNWNQHDDVPLAEQRACRRLGMAIHALRGEQGMREAYYAAKSCNRYATVIQAYWDGIGDWRW